MHTLFASNLEWIRLSGPWVYLLSFFSLSVPVTDTLSTLNNCRHASAAICHSLHPVATVTGSREGRDQIERTHRRRSVTLRNITCPLRYLSLLPMQIFVSSFILFFGNARLFAIPSLHYHNKWISESLHKSNHNDINQLSHRGGASGKSSLKMITQKEKTPKNPRSDKNRRRWDLPSASSGVAFDPAGKKVSFLDGMQMN